MNRIALESNSDLHRSVLITGGSRGIGLATVRALAPTSREVFIVSKDPDRLNRVVSELSAEFTHCTFYGAPIDLADLDSIPGDLDQLPIKHLDGIVLCAGTYTEGRIQDIDLNDYLSDLNINLNSMIVIVRRLLPALRLGRAPKIILIGSTAAYEPYPAVPSYGIAKFGVRSLAINLRTELVSDGIGVTLVSPGGTLTDMWEGEDLPNGRLLEPSDVASTVLYAMSLSPQAVVEEVLLRPMLGDIHE